MSRARTRIEARNKQPEIKPWHEEYTLSDSSPSGLRYLVNGNPSVVAGCAIELTWPHDKSMAQHCIWPRHYSMSVVVGYEGTDLGGFMAWDMELETVSAWVVREILLEHAERAQQLQLLEQHLEQHLEVA
jgi:glycerol-3-phosphate dehydrogenase